MDELNKKFTEWNLRDATHRNRFLGIVQRHTDIAGHWIEIVKKYPANSPEIVIEINSMWKQLGNLFDEAREVCLDLANDSGTMVDFLDALKEELMNLRNEKS